MNRYNLVTYLNLSLLVIFPIAWTAPLMSTGLLPAYELPIWLGGNVLFTPDTLTVLSGIHTLWQSDKVLACVVASFALVAPMLKCLGLALIHLKLLPNKLKSWLTFIGKLAMAEVFLLALFIILAKGIGIGQLEVQWGLHVFTAAVIISLLISMVEPKHNDDEQNLPIDILQ